MIKLASLGFSHWANIAFKLILLALVMVWIIFPPHQSKALDISHSRVEAATEQRG